MNSIPQNLRNVIKNRIKTLISPIFYNMVDFSVDNLFSNYDSDKYLYFIASLQKSVREYIKTIIVTTFEEIDREFKNSPERIDRFYVNKSNVNRTLTTIFGTISFKRTYYTSKFSGKHFFYVDSAFALPKYDHYDPIVKAIAISNASQSSQSASARSTSAFIADLSYFADSSAIKNIPRQSIFNWINSWHVPNVLPSEASAPNTLYVMADEKYIGAQDIDKDIMVKSFVAFEDIKDVSKGRRALVNRSVFSHYGDGAWPAFMDFISHKYDFENITNICLLGDGASWIKSGTNELKLSPNNTVKFYLCEFHFKQAINHITSDKDERRYLLHIFNIKSKKYFIDSVNTIINQNPKRKETLTKKLDYIINNYSYIKSMLNLNIGSSMESHISHLIASFFSSRPKGFSTKRIKQYLKINDYKNNNLNLFNLYIMSYNNKETVTINEKHLDFSIFDKDTINNVPVLTAGKASPEYTALHALAHSY